jgi:uncharacterized LabA/DUF88 family protein
MQLLPKPQPSPLLSWQLEPKHTPQGDRIEDLSRGNPIDQTWHNSQPSQPSQVNQRLAIFIDGANLFHAAIQLNLEIDYTKLLRCITGDRQLLRAYFYTGVDPSNEKQKGFLLWMSRNGYRVIAKELTRQPDGTNNANLDVEMAIDMILLSQYCDRIVLLSGDGDLAYAVNKVAYTGVQVEVIGLSSMTSSSLIDVADRYINLESIKHSIQK